MLQMLFRQRPEAGQARDLYLAVTRQARSREFYTTLGVPDRIDARFELYTLHVLLLVQRLRADGPRGAEVGQRLFDDYVSALDDSLRELGVGDLAVAKKMRRLGEAVYGRMTAYEAALAGEASLAEALARNVYAEEGGGEALAAYASASRDRLAAQDFDALVAGPAWAEIAS